MATAPWDYYEHRLMRQGPSPLKPTFKPIFTLLQTLTGPEAPPHALSHHLMIHFTEPRTGPRDLVLYGVDAADALADLLPMAGHLQHMPSHLYLRIGAYAKGLARSIVSVYEADGYYLEHCLCPCGIAFTFTYLSASVP